MQRGVHLDDATGRCQHSLRSSAKPQRAPSQMKARVTALSIVILLLSGLLSRRKKSIQGPSTCAASWKMSFRVLFILHCDSTLLPAPRSPLFPLVTEMEIPLQAELFILWPLLLIKSLMTGRKAESCFRQHNSTLHSFPLHLKFD